MTTLYITHPVFHRHNMGAQHPECPERLDAINDQLVASRIRDYLADVEPKPASVQDLLRAHTQTYVELIKNKTPTQGYVELDGDTTLNPSSYEAALYAAGAGITALDKIMMHQANNAFCAIRPPGHHATANDSMGFCIFNNLAITAKYALDHYQFERIAVIDFDVHHGNGTEDILASDPRILMCSFYQQNLFPYVPNNKPQLGSNCNIPVPAYTDNQAIHDIVTQQWLPCLHKFKPQLILVSAGFDAHREDDMGQLKLTEADFSWITKQINQIALEYAEGRVISFLEGGYSLSALGRSVVAHLRVLADVDD